MKHLWSVTKEFAGCYEALERSARMDVVVADVGQGDDWQRGKDAPDLVQSAGASEIGVGPQRDALYAALDACQDHQHDHQHRKAGRQHQTHGTSPGQRLQRPVRQGVRTACNSPLQTAPHCPGTPTQQPT